MYEIAQRVGFLKNDGILYALTKVFLKSIQYFFKIGFSQFFIIALQTSRNRYQEKYILTTFRCYSFIAYRWY